MTRRRARTLTGVASALVLLASACGASDDVSLEDPPPTSTTASDPAVTPLSTDSDPAPDDGDAVEPTTTEEPTAPTDAPNDSAPPVDTAEPDGGDTGPIELCEDVPELVSGVISDVAGNPDDEFVTLVRGYGLQFPDTFGSIWIDRNAGGTVVAGFTDDPEPHRDRIAALIPDELGDVGWDVMQVRFTDAEIPDRVGEVVERANDGPVEVVSSGYRVTLQRFTLGLAEPTADALVELEPFVDPDLVCVEGPLLDPDRTIFEPGDELDVIVQPDADGDVADGLRVGCPSRSTYPLANVLDPTFLVDAERNDLLDGIERTIAGGGIEVDDPPPPLDRWVLLDEDDDEALVHNPEGNFLRQMSLRMTAGRWLFSSSSSGGGDCELLVELPDGLGEVEWTVDPDVPLDSDASNVAVLATEQACTGASEMGERLLGPQVVETDTEVLISFAAIPLSGSQTCPGNPSTPVTIELDQPLGDRTVREGRSTGFTLDELLAR